MSQPNSTILDVTVRTDTKPYTWCQYLNKFVKTKRKPLNTRSGFCKYYTEPLHIKKVITKVMKGVETI